MLGKQTSDSELLIAWGNGCREAGDALIERHFATVYRFFRSKVGVELEDLVQQTFLACVEARSRFRGESSFKTFLLAIARYQLYARYSQMRKEALDVTLTSIRDLGASPTGILVKREQEARLIDALQRLPIEAQMILELAYAEGLDGPEIAAVLEVPLNTVYSRLSRAKQQLRELLGERKNALSEAELGPVLATLPNLTSPED